MAKSYNVQIRIEDEGNTVYYSGADEILEELCDLIQPNAPIDVISVEEIEGEN